MRIRPFTLSILSFVFVLAGVAVGQEKLTANEVVAQSLAAIGTPESRAQLSYYEMGGKAKMKTSVRSFSTDGTVVLVSEKNQVKLKTTFESPSYTGDQFVFNGQDVMISKDTRGGRSAIGDLLFNQPKIVSDGLLGGVLSTAWPLFDPKFHGATIEYDGVKKIGGDRLHQLTYSPRKGSDRLTIHIYLDESFRHVKTVYVFNAPGRNAAKGRTASPETSENTFTLEETFGGFLKIAGLTLPTRHSFAYSSTNGDTGRWNFDFTYDNLNGTKLPAVE